MESYLQPIVASILFRILELDPSVTSEEAFKHALSILHNSDLIGVSDSRLENCIADEVKTYTRCGVINPNWLQEKGLYVHFFLVNARPGWLEHIITETEQASKGISQYILYGDYDSLIILHGTCDEAEKQNSIIENDIYADSLYFSAKSVPLIYRYCSVPVNGNLDWPKAEILNQIVENFDNVDLQGYRDKLLSDKVLLGPVWQPANPRDRLIAFVGVSLRGRHEILPMQMLQTLQGNEAIRKTLVHLFETDKGHPYKYLAKLVCKDQDELDKATNEISAIRFGQVHIEGTTMVVSNGFDQIPLYRTAVVAFPGELPMLQDVEIAAREMVKEMGPEAAMRFNKLESSLKLSVLSALARINEQFERTSVLPEWKNRLRETVRQFGNGALDGAGPGLDGAVTAATNTVESAAKRAIRLLAEKEFGLDYALAQKELKLPTKDFRQLTLGKIANALYNIRQDRRYIDFWSHLEESHLETFSSFIDERNKWLHAAKQDLSRTRRIHNSADTIVRSIELTGWLINDIVVPLKQSNMSASPLISEKIESLIIGLNEDKRDVGFFISYSSKDKDIARRISVTIRAIGLQVFFDEWSIGPSHSIVQKINEGILQHDTLAVILSPNSVNSQWVKRELNSAVMAQLSGYNVRVLPLLVETCEIPVLLKDIRYIDFTKGFEDGIIELIRYIKQRRIEKE